MENKLAFVQNTGSLEGLYHKSSDGKTYWRFEDGTEIEITALDIKGLAKTIRNKDSND